jgi:N-methylhydantoinase A
VTDANVVLGRLNPVALVGGSFPIDAARAHEAVASVAAPLGGDVARAAAGIVALVDAEMAKVLRIVSVERGLDPRDFALMAFGGGGPLHACALAADLDVARVVVPPAPGLFSALGLLAADVRVTLARSLVAPLSAASAAAAAALAGELASEARAQLRAQDVAADAIRIIAELDVRYAGQSFDLTVPLADDAAAIAEAFHARHERRYGYASRDERVELAAVRVTSIGASGALPAVPHGGGDANAARTGARPVWDAGAYVDAAVYERERLARGATVAGPAIVEQYDTTTWIPAGWRGTVDPHANLVLERTNG